MSRLYIVTCLFNLYAEYFMRNARLCEAQAGIKIAGRNINNLRYEDNTIIKAESEEQNSLLRTWKKRVKNFNIQKTKIMAAGLITSWHIWRNSVNSGWFYFSGLQNHCRWWLQPWNKKLTPWKKSYDQPRQHIKKQRHTLLKWSI